MSARDIHPLAHGNGKPPGTTSFSGSITLAGTEMDSYYGRPIIKEPVWQPEIPTYFFMGGLAGASSILGLAARAAGNKKLARTGLYLSLAGDVASPLLLISDLGRPERFLNMFRVFKVTSPMSVGSWVLGASGGTTTIAAVLEMLGLAPRVKVVFETFSAFWGAPLSIYTATLISNTAVPVWHEARRELPLVFGSSAAATAGAAASLIVRPREAGPARRLAVGGAVAEIVGMLAMKRRLGALAEPYHKGLAGKLDKVTKAAVTTGAALLATRGRHSRAAAMLGSSLLLGGELALRWTIFKAGFESARDPKYTVISQRGRQSKAQPQSSGAPGQS